MIIARIASAKKLSVQLALHCHCCYCPFQRWFSYIWELFSHPVIFRKVAHVTKRSATRILRKNVAVMKLLLAGDALLESHLYPSGALLLFEWYFMTPRQTNKHYQANGHFSVLWLTTNHLISPVPPPQALTSLQTKIPVSPAHPYLSLLYESECLFCSLSLQKQMASSPPQIQRWSCVGWNLMPTCAPRHAFHRTNGSLLSVCLHCWAKLNPLTPMDH